MNYFNVVGLMVGSMTCAMALPYAQSLSNENNQAAICYATLSPFATFLRVMAAQLLILIFCSFTTADSIQPQLLPNTINTEIGEEYGPTLTLDDNTLYFVGLNRSESNVSEDIFISRRDRRTGEWSRAMIVQGLSNPYRNEAPTGNWQADAMIAVDGSALLFAANYPAEGEEKPSLNIFVSERDAQGRWGKPYSIGSVVNTPGMERSPFLHPDMKTLYFSSNREGTLGDLDVWVSRRLSDTCWNCWSEPENLGEQIHDIYRITLPEDKRPEQITVLKANEAVAINNLLFETGSDVIMEVSLPELKRIATFVSTYGYKVRLAGHTDNIGQPEANKALSQARAESVRRQLIAYGCSPEKISAFGYGDTQPVADNNTEEGRQQNRRVEITIQY